MDEIDATERYPRGGFFRKVQDRGDRSMQLRRLVRTLVPVVMLGLIGFVLGCSGGQDTTPPDKATEKKIAEETKKAREEMKAERQQAARQQAAGEQSSRDSMRKERMRGRGPG
jgi:hypothetical protein